MDTGGGVEVVRVDGWERFAWLKHGFSTRAGGASVVYRPGDLNLGFTKDDETERVKENRERFLRAVYGEENAELVTVRQVHGVVVRRVEAGEEGLATDDGRAVVEADGLVTGSAGVVLGIQVADCVPVLVADVRQQVVAAFHAGWRGTVAAIVARGIAQMRNDFGSRAEDLVGAVGPSIGSCCYAVGEEVRGEFERGFGYAGELFEVRDGAMYLDLAEANRRQMVEAGVGQVSVLGECTGCAVVGGRRRYFSHRMEQGFTGRSMGMIGVATKDMG